jgi:hypothetical protein
MVASWPDPGSGATAAADALQSSISPSAPSLPAMLSQALEVMKEWGFQYKSHYVWVKDRAVTGHWARARHELLLVATRGRVPAPALGSQWESVIEARWRRRSAWSHSNLTGSPPAVRASHWVPRRPEASARAPNGSRRRTRSFRR